jgi:hypothetical protein
MAVCVAGVVAAKDDPLHPAPVAPTLHLDAGDVLDLTQREDVVASEQHQFTATAMWTMTAEVEDVRADKSVACVLKFGRLVAEMKSKRDRKAKTQTVALSIDTDAKPSPYLVGADNRIAGWSQLAGLAGSQIRFVLGPDGKIEDTIGTLRKGLEQRDGDRVKADGRAEVQRFFLPLPNAPVKPKLAWEFSLSFAPTPYEIEFRAVDRLVESLKVRTATVATMDVDLEGWVPAISRDSQRVLDGLRQVAMVDGTHFVEVDGCALKGTARFDLATGLAVERREEMTARTIETYTGGAQPIFYKVTTVMTCARRAK